MATRIYANARAPESLRFTVTSGASRIDLSVVTAAVLRVRRLAGGDAVDWSATIESKTAGELVLVHTFDALGQETAQLGTFTAQAIMTVPDGVRRSAPVSFQVL